MRYKKLKFIQREKRKDEDNDIWKEDEYKLWYKKRDNWFIVTRHLLKRLKTVINHDILTFNNNC